MKILKFKKFKGLHIVCKGCNKSIEVNQSAYKGCSHPIEKQRYKAVIRIDGSRKTKDLTNKVYEDAVSELIAWKKVLENPLLVCLNQKQEAKQVELLEDCIWMYSDWLEDIGVPVHERKNRSQKHIKQTVKYIIEFKSYIQSIGFDINKKSITDITSTIFGKYYENMGIVTKSVSTYNHKIKSVKGFFNYIVDVKKYRMEHPCRKVSLKHESPNPISVGDNDFKKLLSVVNAEDSIQIVGGERKNRYRSWTADSFKLAAFTGMRLDEVAELKYSDIVLDTNNELDYITGVDLKYERAHNWDNSKPKKMVPIPITPELKELLIKLDYKSYLGQDRYLIDSDNNMNRKSVSKAMSHAFTFFRRKAGLPDTFSIKHLRKTFLTKLQTQTGLAASAGYQKTISVIDKHYLDKIAISRSIRDMKFSYFDSK